ncbi:hypothetical protein JCM11251_002302 [Rhodosporidiobolus azoricus]
MSYASYYAQTKRELVGWETFAHEQADKQATYTLFPTRPPQFTPAELVKRRYSAPANSVEPATFVSNRPVSSPSLGTSTSPTVPESDTLAAGFTQPQSSSSSRLGNLFRRRGSAPACTAAGSPPPSSVQSSTQIGSIANSPIPAQRSSLFRRPSTPLPPSSTFHASLEATNPPLLPPLLALAEEERDSLSSSIASSPAQRYNDLVPVAVVEEPEREGVGKEKTRWSGLPFGRKERRVGRSRERRKLIMVQGASEGRR